MIFRPFTVLCLLAAAGFGWNLFEVKRSTAQLDRELAGIAEQIRAAQKQKETLESVWGTLNDLPKLRQLSQRLLPQEVTQTPQNRSFAELERRLPAAQQPDATPSAFAQRGGASAPDVAIALLPPAPSEPHVILASASAAPLPRAAATVAAPLVAAPAPMTAPADAVAEAEVLPLPPPVPPHLLAMADPRPSFPATPRAIAAPAPRQSLPASAAPAGVATPAPAPSPGPAPGQIAYARPAPPRPLPAPEPPARSLLGGLSAPLLAPPVPYGTANAATLGNFGR